MRSHPIVLGVIVALAFAAGVEAETRDQRTERERRDAARIERCALEMTRERAEVVFGPEWSAPVEIPGEEGLRLEFRKGRLNTVDGSLGFSDGLEARISTPEGWTSYYYTFSDGRWTLAGFAAVIDGPGGPSGPRCRLPGRDAGR